MGLGVAETEADTVGSSSETADTRTGATTVGSVANAAAAPGNVLLA
jgi:hypothetical protein